MTERIGVIVVHGVGEQTRFEFLDQTTREIIRALQDLGWTVGVDIASASAAAFHSAQDTWAGGPEPSVTLHVSNNGQEKDIGIHEVWWADINEAYTLRKQIRFWLWGLGVWAYPKRWASKLATAARVVPPNAFRRRNPALPRDRRRQELRKKECRARAELYLTACLFVLLGLSLGGFVFIVFRLLSLARPKGFQLVANYVSGVKLYTQKRRYDGSTFGAEQEFLDNIGEPPRVSVRRRMIRTIADVACQGYDRWYVLAHSQGSVVAFNGLMETAYAWPGYLDPERWERLRCKQLAGVRANFDLSNPETLPPRPLWAFSGQIAYRRRIFRRFRGLLTFGCPLEKFATIWPALVPISREPGFSPDAVWINVLDPVDPVSGVLRAFAGIDPACCPRLYEVGYATYWVLLYSHLRYFTPRRPERDDLATAVARWLLTGDPAPLIAKPVEESSRWYSPGGRVFRRRRGVAFAWYAAVTLTGAVIAAFFVPLMLDVIGQSALGLWQRVAATLFGTGAVVGRGLADWCRCARDCIWGITAAVVLFAPLLVGWMAHVTTYRNDAEGRFDNRPPVRPRDWALAAEDRPPELDG